MPDAADAPYNGPPGDQVYECPHSAMPPMRLVASMAGGAGGTEASVGAATALEPERSNVTALEGGIGHGLEGDDLGPLGELGELDAGGRVGLELGADVGRDELRAGTDAHPAGERARVVVPGLAAHARRVAPRRGDDHAVV